MQHEHMDSTMDQKWSHALKWVYLIEMMGNIFETTKPNTPTECMLQNMEYDGGYWTDSAAGDNTECSFNN